MDIETKIQLILRRPTEEVITLDELRVLLETKAEPIAYDGFEPSGIPHLATGLLKVLKVKDLTDAGCKYILFLADAHAWINEKLGGDLERIRLAGELFIACWKTLMEAFHVDQGRVQFKWGTEVYDEEYWHLVLRVARKISLARAKRSLTIAGRRSAEAQNLATYFYIPMQIADIFHMKIDICQLGIDQRKANILAREVGPSLGLWKPICVHHHLLMGLKGPKKMGLDDDEVLDLTISSKMSKSKPETCIYVIDSPEIIKSKLLSAYCPPRETIANPVIDICRNILLRHERLSLTIDRPIKYGGEVTYYDIKELEEDYKSGRLHPLDLKIAVANELAKLMEPCRRLLQHGWARKALQELYRG